MKNGILFSFNTLKQTKCLSTNGCILYAMDVIALSEMLFNNNDNNLLIYTAI